MRWLAVLPALPLAACAVLAPMSCPDGENAAVIETLYFGTAKAGGAVSEQEWAAFLREVVTPRFPEGFTAWPAAGQWRDASGAAVSEKSFVLSIVHPPGGEAPRRLAEVAAQYKSRFAQEAVLRVSSPGCSSL